jgi:hypothetical protein
MQISPGRFDFAGSWRRFRNRILPQIFADFALIIRGRLSGCLK